MEAAARAALVDPADFGTVRFGAADFDTVRFGADCLGTASLDTAADLDRARHRPCRADWGTRSPVGRQHLGRSCRGSPVQIQCRMARCRIHWPREHSAPLASTLPALVGRPMPPVLAQQAHRQRLAPRCRPFPAPDHRRSAAADFAPATPARRNLVWSGLPVRSPRTAHRPGPADAVAVRRTAACEPRPSASGESPSTRRVRAAIAQCVRPAEFCELRSTADQRRVRSARHPTRRAAIRVSRNDSADRLPPRRQATRDRG